MYEDIVYQLALCYQREYNYSKIRILLQHFGTAKNIYLTKRKQLEKNIFPNKSFLPLKLDDNLLKQIDFEREMMEKNNISFCFYNDEKFPKRLYNCLDAPFCFFYRGNSDFHFTKSIAMVGTRKASQYGKDCSRRIIETLAGSDIVIVSGLAIGIDSSSHQNALDYGLRTIAVMGTGFNCIYPDTNYLLAENIVRNGGTLITEFPFSTQPERYNFPIRNRLIAGLADATIVVETALRGGSIITAQIANSYNRDVFAIPGSIFNETNEGCHDLIKRNLAALVNSGNDILTMMNWDKTTHFPIQRTIFRDLSEDETKIVAFIEEKKESSIDEIIAKFNEYTVSKVTAFLLTLEFKGIIVCKPGKIYSVIA